MVKIYKYVESITYFFLGLKMNNIVFLGYLVNYRVFPKKKRVFLKYYVFH